MITLFGKIDDGKGYQYYHIVGESNRKVVVKKTSVGAACQPALNG
jgi:hypothetical protein